MSRVDICPECGGMNPSCTYQPDPPVVSSDEGLEQAMHQRVCLFDRAVCFMDGEPWPCRAATRLAHNAGSQPDEGLARDALAGEAWRLLVEGARPWAPSGPTGTRLWNFQEWQDKALALIEANRHNIDTCEVANKKN